MKFVRSLTLAGLGVTSITALIIAQGCGGSSSSSSSDAGSTSDAPVSKTDAKGTGSGSGTTKGSGTGSGAQGSGSGSSGGATTVGQAPQPPKGAAATTATTPHNFAIHNLYLGDTDPTSAFTTDAKAWETFGYNIDGKITTAQSTDVCTPFTKGQTAQQIDGPQGQDNAFGNIIVDQILSIPLPNPSQTVTGDIAKGSFTLEFDVVGLDGTATQTATGLTGQVFAGSTYTATGGLPATTGTAPNTMWAVTDDWPINGSLVTNPSGPAPYKSQIAFSNSYVTGGTWVSNQQDTTGVGKPLTINLSLKGVTLALTIHSPVITMPVTKDSAGQFHSKAGMVSGVLETTELVTAIQNLAAALGYSTIVATFLPTIKGASDITVDATSGAVTNAAGTACNGISIGLGFDADEIAQPDTVAATATGSGSGSTTGSGSGSTTGSGSGSTGSGSGSTTGSGSGSHSGS